MASSTCGLSKPRRAQLIERGKPLYLLETFFAGENTCSEVLRDCGTDNFLLDSGAFSFMSGAQCSKQSIMGYADRYIQFINEYHIKRFFEIDVDTIFGIEFVENLRRRIEVQTGRKSIPVWHKSRGIEYWKRMVDQYEYVAIGGLVFHTKKSEMPFIKKMVTYAKSKGVKVHGLGFTKTKELREWDWYSVDSSAWTKAAALGQRRHDFNGQYIESQKICGNGFKVDLEKLICHNGLEWCKYQRYMRRY